MRRGEVYFVNLDPAMGREQAGRRPVLVVSDDAINSKPLVVTVVAGSNGEHWSVDYPTNVRVSAAESGLPKETVFICFQLRSLDHARFVDSKAKQAIPAAKLSPRTMTRIDIAIRLALALEE